MKKVFAIALTFLLLCAVPASAELPDLDLSALTYEELVELHQQVMLAMWSSEDWQEVTVPQGVYKVGESIPAGKWTITCKTDSYVDIECGTVLKKDGTGIDYSGYISSKMIYNPDARSCKEGDCTSWTFDLKEGQYISVEYTSCIFTPYAGAPDLGFK